MEEAYPRLRENMIQNQIIRRGVTDARVLNAFRQVPRHVFVPKEYQNKAYADHPLPIGEDQTISQPYIVALMTNCLFLTGDERVLEIGTGSGYQTAILSLLAKEVFSVEIIRPLSDRAMKVFKTQGYINIYLYKGDGSTGWEEHAPYDRIVFTAAVPQFSEEILTQVVDGGRIVAPIGGRWRQELQVWTREGSSFLKEKILPVAFVPLRGDYGWQD